MFDITEHKWHFEDLDAGEISGIVETQVGTFEISSEISIPAAFVITAVTILS